MGWFLFNVLVLFLFWVGLSGILDAFHLGVGLLSAALIYYLDIRNDTKSGKKKPDISTIVQRVLTTLLYVGWLLSRILLAAAHVSKMILSKDMKLNAKFIEHKTILTGDAPKTLFANSITLTPGTITVDIQDGGNYVVHQLDDDSAGDIQSNEMEKRIQRIFGSKSND